jgi:ABC-type polysaccharide/polyol phosphate export permease
VKDRATRVRHLLRINGLPPLSYWAALLAHDVTLYIIDVILLLIVAAAFNMQPFVGAALGPFIVALFEYVFAVTLFSYVVSFLFSTAETAYRMTSMVFQIVAIIPTIVIQVPPPPLTSYPGRSSQTTQRHHPTPSSS